MGSYGWLSDFLTDARQTVAPPRGAKDGLLPPRAAPRVTAAVQAVIVAEAVTMTALAASPGSRSIRG